MAINVLDCRSDVRKVLAAVSQSNVALVILAKRGFAAFEGRKTFARQCLVDGPHSIRPFGVIFSGVVIEESRMRDQDCRHLFRRSLRDMLQASSDSRAIWTPGGGLLSTGTKKSGANGIDLSTR